MMLHGLIMMGGKSRRMGQDKAYIKIKNKYLWQHACDCLKNFTQKNYFSLAQESKNFTQPNIILDIFNQSYGPLGGIISAFKSHPNSSLFVLACDLPNFNSQAAEYLISRRNKDKLATVFINQENKIEPLCGIYEYSIFFDLLKYWAKDIFCPRKILSNLNIEKVKIPNSSWIFNMNTTQDYEKISLEKLNYKKIKIYYYASLQEQSGVSREKFDTSANNLEELFSQLQDKYKFSHAKHQIRVAQNDEIVGWDNKIKNGDSVIFMPPVSGG